MCAERHGRWPFCRIAEQEGYRKHGKGQVKLSWHTNMMPGSWGLKPKPEQVPITLIWIRFWSALEATRLRLQKPDFGSTSKLETL
jgi:hypothetical protein